MDNCYGLLTDVLLYILRLGPLKKNVYQSTETLHVFYDTGHSASSIHILMHYCRF